MEFRVLLEAFRGRLSDNILDDCHNYYNHNEPALAVEVLNDWLFEDDIAITLQEYLALTHLARVMGCELKRFSRTWELIADEKR